MFYPQSYLLGERSSYDKKVNVKKIYFWKMFQHLVTQKEERRVRDCLSEKGGAERHEERDTCTESKRGRRRQIWKETDEEE